MSINSNIQMRRSFQMSMNSSIEISTSHYLSITFVPFQVWIKLIFFLQSASMTILYPYINLHMKSLGISIQASSDPVLNHLVD